MTGRQLGQVGWSMMLDFAAVDAEIAGDSAPAQPRGVPGSYRWLVLPAAGGLAGKACLMARAGTVVLAPTGVKYAAARGNHGQRSPAVRHSGPPGGGGGY
jgi:hypothetical protein